MIANMPVSDQCLRFKYLAFATEKGQTWVCVKKAAARKLVGLGFLLLESVPSWGVGFLKA